MTQKQKAILLMLLSTFSFSVMQLVVKLSGGAFPVMEQVLARNLVTLFVGAYLVVKAKDTFFGKPENRLAVLGRSILGYIGVVGYFYATKHMNVADASLLHRSSPFFVILFSAIFLRIPLRKVQGAALLIAFAGSVLVIRPGFDSSVFPALIGVLSAAGAGGAYVLINYLKGKESNATIIFCFSLVSTVLSILLGWREFHVPVGVEWLYLLGIGICAAAGQIALTSAYKMTAPGEVSIINYLGIAFSAVLGLVFLQEAIGLRSLLGMVCIFSAALLLYFHKD